MHLRNFDGDSACSHIVSDAEFCACHTNVSVPDMFWMMTRGENLIDEAAALHRRARMLISVPIIVLGSHLAITVADNVPKFDIARGCRLDNTASSGLTEEQPLRKCVSDEQQALQQLQTQWSQFSESDRATCTTTATSDDTPSYVELLTCLQEAKEVRGQSKK
jgi:hypothetical protein